jgi:hypothetical protein
MLRYAEQVSFSLCYCTTADSSAPYYAPQQQVETIALAAGLYTALFTMYQNIIMLTSNRDINATADEIEPFPGE